MPLRRSSLPRVRLAIFTSHPIQYDAPLFRALADEARLRPVIFYGCRHGAEAFHDREFDRIFAWDVPLLDGYEHVTLENRALRTDPSSFFGVVVSDLRRYWTKKHFDVAMLLGWYTFGHLQALQAAWAAGIPVVVRGDSTLERDPRSSIPERLLRRGWLPMRRVLYRWAFSRVEAFLTVGSRNEAFFGHFGVPASKLQRVGYSIDHRRFALPSVERRRSRAEIRSVLGVSSDSTVYLFVGKLVPHKRPGDALEAFSVIASGASDVALVFVGDGELGSMLRRSASARPALAGKVHFPGFVNQRRLPGWYAAADCLVVTSSTETWGLVVNEAMAAGLPVIASSAVGCAPDLIREGENGWTYPMGDKAELASLLRRLHSLPADARRAMGRRSRELVADCTPESVARRCAGVLTHVARAGT